MRILEPLITVELEDHGLNVPTVQYERLQELW